MAYGNLTPSKNLVGTIPTATPSSSTSSVKGYSGSVNLVGTTPTTAIRGGQVVPINQTPSTQTTPSVITSSQATKDLDKIKAENTKIVEGLNNQQITIANNQAIAEATARAKAELDRNAKMAADKAAIEKQNAETKAQAVKQVMAGEESVPEQNPVIKEKAYEGNQEWRTITRADGTSQVVSKAQDGSYIPVDQKEISLQENKNLQTKELEAYTAAANNVSEIIKNIQNGIVPLNAGEMAQIQGLQQSFDQLVKQQQLDNISAANTGQIRGYQKGAAEYDPNFQTKTIGTIITAGANKVADLNIKMASAVAALTQSFKDDNIKAIKDSWDVYNQAAEKRQAALQKTIDTAQAQITKAQDAKLADEKAKTLAMAKVQEDVDVIMKEASINGAPASVLAAIRNATSVSEAISAADGYTGDKLDRQLKLAQIEKLKAEALETASKAEANSPAKKEAQARSETLGLLSLVDSIIESPYREQVFGVKNPLTYWTPGSNEQMVKNQVKQLKGNLSLENREKLKGSGAVSDFEFRVLAQSASALDKNLSDEDSLKELKKVRGVMSTAAGLPATVQIKDPLTGEVQVIEATREGIDQAIIDGLLVEYI